MKMNAAFSLWVALAVAPSAMAQTATADDFFTIYNLIRDNFNFGRTLVRLAFHDAMGGVDGWVNIGHTEHNGLANTVNTLSNLYDANSGSFSAALSRADFFAWSYVAGFYIAVPNNVPWVPLTYGRADNDGSNLEVHPPNSGTGAGDHAAVVQYFANEFDMTNREMAVLLGAHTLGGAELANSGYVGDWTRQENTFNNGYYDTLVDPPGGGGGWEQVQVQGGKFEWRWGCNQNGNGCRDLMLNVDMNLFINLDGLVNQGTGEASLPNNPIGNLCDNGRIFADCFEQRTNDDTHDVVAQYSVGDNDEFMLEFAAVYAKLLDFTKLDSTLTVVAQPIDWPAGIFPGGGGDGGNNGGGNGGNGGRPGGNGGNDGGGNNGGGNGGRPGGNGGNDGGGNNGGGNGGNGGRPGGNGGRGDGGNNGGGNGDNGGRPGGNGGGREGGGRGGGGGGGRNRNFEDFGGFA